MSLSKYAVFEIRQLVQTLGAMMTMQPAVSGTDQSKIREDRENGA